MTEKCTNTSCPLWRWMKPKPLLALNHFTVPCALLTALLFSVSRLRLSITKLSYLVPFRAPQQSLAVFGRTQKKAASVTLRPLSSRSKGDTRASNAIKYYHKLWSVPSPFLGLFEQQILRPVRQRHADSAPTLTAEHLASLRACASSSV